MQEIFVRFLEFKYYALHRLRLNRLRYEETNATQIKYKLTYRKKSNYEITIFFISDEEKKTSIKHHKHDYAFQIRHKVSSCTGKQIKVVTSLNMYKL